MHLVLAASILAGQIVATPATQRTPESTARGIMLDHVKLTELKARAARFRSEAAHLEAEAVRLEIKAREMREELANMG